MYCKHCGNQIADDSVFCSRCGKIVVEASPRVIIQLPQDKEQWIPTKNTTWKKPYVARVTHIVCIAVSTLFLIYSITCVIHGGKVSRYFGDSRTLSVENPGTKYFRETRQYEETLKIKDILGIFHIEKKKWNQPSLFTFYGNVIPWAFTPEEVDDAHFDFRKRVVLFGVLPAIIFLIIAISWTRKLKFPTLKDGLPRDYADEIEPYELSGFCKYKYVFFKKDGKYGIIDATHYCVKENAKYDTITWRIPNKIYDAEINGQKKTFNIENI